jgi:hypothetical protein
MVQGSNGQKAEDYFRETGKIDPSISLEHLPEVVDAFPSGHAIAKAASARAEELREALS